MMTKPPNKPDRITQILHLLLLLGCTALVAIRAHINEMFPANWHFNAPINNPSISAGETPAMLITAGIIMTFALLWFVNQCRTKTLTWKKTALVLPWCLLLIAGVISTSVASNKYTAIVGVLNFITPMLLAILLIQLLDSRWKIHLLLAVLTATGVSLAYRCWEQKTYDAPATVSSVMKNFDAAMTNRGIEPGTYTAQQFKDRILSQDIGGLFAISNTAASYFILTIFATLALMADKIKLAAKNQKSYYYLTGGLLVAAQLCGLMITKSKGGIAAFFAALIFAILLYAGRSFFRKHAKASFVAALLLILIGTAALIGHGLYHHRLPTTSLWIRWQYWVASFSMIADHLWTGVGAENFGQYYPRYMDPTAPEVIKDPHNFWLAMLSQWGLLGLTATVWAVLAFSLKIITPIKNNDLLNHEEKPALIKTIAGGLIIITAILLARIFTSRNLGTLSESERQSVYLITFFVPATIWLIAFLLATINKKSETTKKIDPKNPLAIICLASALLGLLLHNSIDFAIFQPGVTTGFFALVATCLAFRQLHTPDTTTQKSFSVFRGWIFSGAACVPVLLVWSALILPQCAAHYKLKQAQAHATHTNDMIRQKNENLPFHPNLTQITTALQKIYPAAKDAASLNPFDPAALTLQAKITYRLWQVKPQKQPALLQQAIGEFTQAAQRDPQNFSYYHQTSTLYQHLAEKDPNVLHQALKAAHQAFLRNPVKPEVMISYADLLNKTGKPDLAQRIYQLILADDRDFQQQQKVMSPFPQTTPTPRLHPTLKKKAEEALEKLSFDPALIP